MLINWMGWWCGVHRALVEDPDSVVFPARMWSLGLYKSVVLVLFLLRQNPVQEVAAELFGVSQATVPRRWTALLPVVGKVLAGHVPDPVEASADRIVLVDGTLVTTWDWASEGNQSHFPEAFADRGTACARSRRSVITHTTDDAVPRTAGRFCHISKPDGLHAREAE
jgi:hypothetical protein